jgi:hypothetical protein
MAVRRKIYILTAALGVVAGSAQAREQFSLFEPMRSLTMGGAHLGVADDDLAIFTNPAGLSKKRAPRLSFFDTQMEFSPTIASALSGFVGGMFTGAGQTLYGELASSSAYQYFSLAAVPHFVARNFAVSVLYRTQTAFQQLDANTLDVRRQNDLGVVAGVGIPLFGGVIKLGATGKVIHRGEIDAHTTNGSTFGTFDFDGNYQEGLGVGADAAVTLTAPIRFFPAVSFVVRNIGDMSYALPFALYSSSSGLRPAPTTEPMTYDGGYSMAFRTGPDSYVNFAIDVRDIKTFMSNMSSYGYMDALYQHGHVGLEWMINRMFYIRLGYAQSYPAFGVGFWTKSLALDVGAYGVNIGTINARQVSYRFLTRLEFGF